eukprot:6204334-Pleurochrysis_carterae.AAC.1
MDSSACLPLLCFRQLVGVGYAQAGGGYAAPHVQQRPHAYYQPQRPQQHGYGPMQVRAGACVNARGSRPDFY